MPTTTNYGWTTPADTDLVKDGAAAIRTLGSAIDTTVFNNANAAIAKSIVDAKGDLIAATAADTVARLAVGTNGQYLQADSTTATGLKWAGISAGGMTELASGTLSGASTTISSISSSYKDLVLYIRDVEATNSMSVWGRVNGDGNTNYLVAPTNTSGTDVSLASTQFELNRAQGNVDNFTTIVTFYDYANTVAFKYIDIKFFGLSEPTSPQYSIRNMRAGWANTAAIDSITVKGDGVETLSGSYILYGVA